MIFFTRFVTLIVAIICFEQAFAQTTPKASDDPEQVFLHPPESAKPGALWMWMGSNLSKEGITRDLEALKKQGYNKVVMYHLADVTTPWNRDIVNSPNAELIAWTPPWWEFVRHAVLESRRLKIDFGMHNCPGYESSGGVWIKPEQSMLELCWSVSDTISDKQREIYLRKPVVDPRAKMLWPVYNPGTDAVENPVTEARRTFYKDVVVLALPANGIPQAENVINLSDKLQSDGKLNWQPRGGQWFVYRFGYTTMGTLIQPAQWKATGLECDKMSEAAVSFHMDHILGQIKTHVGDLIGTGLTNLHFDSYEAGTPTWTPKMVEEFAKRRGYDLTSYLPAFAGRVVKNQIATGKFMKDFDETVKDLYRDVYFKTIRRKLHEANLKFSCEPYGGPWRQDDVVPLIDNVMTEFWTSDSIDNPFLDLTIASLRKSGKNIVEAEAFTGLPDSSKWNETPHSVKRYGDEAFCRGVNRLLLHRFVHQPWSADFRPGVAMGQWGTHFDRTQTWWLQSAAMVKYWQRCQALLQWGVIDNSSPEDLTARCSNGVTLKSVHRSTNNVHIWFVANTSRNKGDAICSFNITGFQPELWDAVTGEIISLPQFEMAGTRTSMPLKFDDAQSFFIVFRSKAHNPTRSGSNFPVFKTIKTIGNSWQVSFDTVWGGPERAVLFDSLQDWTKNPDKGIKYYSGTALYSRSFDMSLKEIGKKACWLQLGLVNHIARIELNGRDLGVVWTAPWQVKIPPGALKEGNNQLKIEVTNVWANRLIGDEQEPDDCEWLPGHIWKGRFLKQFPDWFLKKQPRPSAGRYCFTTWNYFTRESQTISSGLLGPVEIVHEK